ncbi:MAG: AAC(3)-I family aminoglycoside N-acetyltransferase [Candidatus Eremiobacteraeota bacterium]|nr:AAC(3)-I family aminoglycoside N-acetyltransferase [Candidatus Eremiobacteraeota bacterium]
MIEYVRLKAEDVARLRELNAVFGEAFGEPDTYDPGRPTDEYLRERLRNQNIIAFVALDERVVIGGLTAYVLDKLEHDRREIYLYDLAVSASHRRRGIARGLIDELRAIARELCAYVIFVQADPPDTPAIRLYESLGAREDVHHFDISVT